MVTKSKLRLLLGTPTLAAVVLAVSPANASTIVTTNNQLAPAAVPAGTITSFTPTYTINNSTDILLGAVPTASTGDFTFERSGGLPILTDGLLGPVSNDGGPTATHPAIAAFGGGSGSGSSVTYAFTPTVLSSIVIYTGWNDNGRDQANFTLQGTTDGTNYFTIGTVSFNPTVANGQQSVIQVAFTDTTGNINAGVALSGLKVNSNTGTENGYSGLIEISANAVPEASTATVLGALGLVGLLRRRRA